MGITYTQQGDYSLQNLRLPSGELTRNIIKKLRILKATIPTIFLKCQAHEQSERSLAIYAVDKNMADPNSTNPYEAKEVVTMEEDASFHPPTCMSCAREHVSTIKTEMIKNIAISVVLMIVGIVVIKNPAGVLLVGIPYGWSFLNKITPAMFVWMSWIG